MNGLGTSDSFGAVRTELERIRGDVDLKLSQLAAIESEINARDAAVRSVANSIQRKLGSLIETESFIRYFEKPYVVIPQGHNRVLVAVPKFVQNFQVGWLWKETDTFYIYQFDQYSAWLSDAPKELLEEIAFKREMQGTVDGDIVHFEPGQRDTIKKKLGSHLAEIGENQARILRGHVFDVVAEMVDNGCLPFKARPIDPEDLREPRSAIKPRPYQKKAIAKFKETGAVGVFHPTGAGKSFIVLHLLDILKGKKLIVIPTRTLAEQWNYYIDTHVPHAKEEVRIVTYQGWRNTDEEFALTVYDEAQRLPADTFARLSVIRTKYRIGLSASPHREDGRERYIFALTGFPIGMNWRDYMESVGRKYHPVFVHVVRTESSKIAKAVALVNPKHRTLIFCDRLELGRSVARAFPGGLPFVSGESSDRMATIQANKVCVVSRVADLGISIKDLRHIVEVDFLFGSRQQELQRTGRLLHSLESNTRHDIIMTQKEFDEYGKRLWALQEKGFTIKVME